MSNWLIFGIFSLLIPANAIAETNAVTHTPNTPTPNTANALNKPNPPNLPNPSNKCQQVVTNILNDLNTYGNDVETQPMLWKKLSWLEDNLGTDIQIETKIQKLYEWKNFKLLVDASGASTAAGDFPDKNHRGPITPEAAINALGKPTNESSAAANQITWDCKNGSKLVIITDDNGNLLTVNPTVCNGSSCIGQITTVGKTALNENMNQSIESNIESARGDLITDYNSHFQTKALIPEDVKNDMTSRLQGYFAKLRACTPGSYQFAIPFVFSILYQESTIKGLDNNKCSVETNFVTPDNHTFNSKCQFQPESLKLFTDERATAVIQGDETKINTSEMLQIMQTECQFFIDGKQAPYGNFVNITLP